MFRILARPRLALKIAVAISLLLIAWLFLSLWYHTKVRQWALDDLGDFVRLSSSDVGKYYRHETRMDFTRRCFRELSGDKSFVDSIAFTRRRPARQVDVLKHFPEVRQVWMWQCPITNLNGLRHCRQLSVLDCKSSLVNDLSPLRDLTELTFLDASLTDVSDLSALAKLQKLSILRLAGTHVHDIRSIADLTKLEHLDLGGTPIHSIAAVAKMSQLKELDISGTYVTDMQSIASHKQLERLTVDLPPSGADAELPESYRQVASITGLRSLTIHGNVTRVDFLMSMKNLELIDLSDTLVTDVSFVSRLASLKRVALNYKAFSALERVRAFRTGLNQNPPVDVDFSNRTDPGVAP